MQRERKLGFTLIETSMVLLIVALLVAIVTTSVHLIRASEIRSVITDINGYKVAIKSFYMQYGEMPGDIKNAQSYWPDTCTDDGVNKCNGNSDNQIIPSTTEGLRAWQHMTLADMIPNTYTGVLDKSEQSATYVADEPLINFAAITDFIVPAAHAKQQKITICHNGHSITVAKPSIVNAHLRHGDIIGSCEGIGGEESTEEEVAETEDYDGKFTIGVNVPASKIKNAGYKIDYNGGALITFAGERNPLLDAPIISSAEAWEIDMKMDDGLAAKGTVLSDDGNGSSGCVGDDGYSMDSKNLTCQMHFWVEAEET